MNIVHPRYIQNPKAKLKIISVKHEIIKKHIILIGLLLDNTIKIRSFRRFVTYKLNIDTPIIYNNNNLIIQPG